MVKKEALFWKPLKNGNVQCLLCPHNCILTPGQSGMCNGKQNIDGRLIAINYGETVSLAIDPIEKKPLYHFMPGSSILSTAPNGCNLRCPFCQNYSISVLKTHTEYISPEELINLALRYNSPSIAFTYSEPLIWYEYILDVARLAEKEGIKLVLVTNGMINEEPLLKLLPYIHGMNIDLKSMDQGYYRRVLKGDLKTVKRTISIAQEMTHVEVTNLIIPGDNDKSEDIEKLVDFIASLRKTIPLHFSRYFPHHKYTRPPTPPDTMRMAYEIGKKKLYYVYVGNIFLPGTENTYCPECGNLLVERSFYQTKIVGIEDGKCSRCSRKVDFVL